MAVNLSPVGGVAAQFFTNSGVILSGGKLLTYAAGTTTPAATYTSSNGSTAHTNPIILNSAGRVPSSGEIWLTDGVSYKFVLTDANDVLIATYDNIVGINSNFVNFTNSQEIQTATAGQTVFTLTTMQYQPGTDSLSVFVDGVNQYGPGAQYAFVETSGTVVTFVTGLHVGASVKFTTSAINASSYGDASQITYDPPFTGSVTTNVEAKLAQTVSVKDFGAVGDGSTDDTAAIQAALDAVTDETFGNVQQFQRLFFPSGVYLISDTLTHTGHFLQLMGEGYQSCLKWTGAQYGTMMSITGVVTDPNGGFVIQDMGFDLDTLGTTALQTQTLSHEITISRILFANGLVNPGNSNQAMCENFPETHSGRIEQCYFHISSNPAISLNRLAASGGPVCWVIEQNEFQGIDADCVFGGNCASVKISNNTIDNAGTTVTGNSAGFNIYQAQNIVIENNYAESLQKSLVTINGVAGGSSNQAISAIIRDNFSVNLPLNSSYQAYNIGGTSPSYATYNVHIYDNTALGTVASFANVGNSSHKTRFGYNVFSTTNGASYQAFWNYVTGGGDWYYDGQYAVSNAVQGVASAVALTTGTAANITSLTLPPGDWDISGKVDFTGGATTTVTYLSSGFSQVSATLPTDYAAQSSVGNLSGTPFANVNYTQIIPTYRVNISTSTTFYLVAKAAFAVSTCSAFGIIQARLAKTYL